jgi:hypothetical protein
MCYNDFKEAKGQIPNSLKEVFELEKQVLPVRLVLLEEPLLLHVHDSMRHFVSGCTWTEEILEKYEAWEQKYNLNNRFRKFPRPGQELLKLVMEVAQFLKEWKAGAGHADELLNVVIQQNKKYEK